MKQSPKPPQIPQKTPNQTSLPHPNHSNICGTKCSQLFSLHNMRHSLAVQKHKHTLTKMANVILQTIVAIISEIL